MTVHVLIQTLASAEAVNKAAQCDSVFWWCTTTNSNATQLPDDRNFCSLLSSWVWANDLEWKTPYGFRTIQSICVSVLFEEIGPRTYWNWEGYDRKICLGPSRQRWARAINFGMGPELHPSLNIWSGALFVPIFPRKQDTKKPSLHPLCWIWDSVLLRVSSVQYF